MSRLSSDGYEVINYQTISDDPAGLEMLIDLFEHSGYEFAKANAEYQKQKKIVELGMRKEGIPATVISDVIKGMDGVNEYLFARDCAEVMYKADFERYQARKLNLRNINAQADREAYQ